MLRLSIRLASVATRASWIRTALAISTIALATGISLYAAGIPRALEVQELRLLRREAPLASTVTPGGSGILWWAPRQNAQWIPGAGPLRSIAVAGDRGAPLPIGSRVLPKPGEVVVSPALSRILDDAHSSVRAFLPGPVVGTLGRDALHDPDELVAYIGWDIATLSSSGHALALTGPPVADRRHAPPTAANSTPVALLSAGIALALILPVAGLLRVALLVDTQRRRRRLHAVGIVGATERELRLFAAVEGLVYGVAGVVVALLVKQAVGIAAPTVRFSGQAMFSADVSPAPESIAAIATLGVLAGMVVSSHVLVPRQRRRGQRPGNRDAILRVTAALFGTLLLRVVGSLARDQASSASRIGLAIGLCMLTFGAAGLVTSALRALVRFGDRWGGPEWFIARRSVRADPVAAARGLGSLALAVVVVALATVAYGSLEAANGGARRSASASPNRPSHLADASVNGITRDQLPMIKALPGVRAVLPRTFGLAGRPELGRLKVVHGSCAALAEAFARNATYECSGVPAAEIYARPGHPLVSKGEAVPLALLAQVFPPVDVLQSRGELPAEVTEVFVDLADKSEQTLATVVSALLRASPTAHLIGAAQRDSAQPSQLALDLDRAALAANSMVVIAVLTALVAGAERLLSRRAVLAHLSAVGMTRGQVRLAAAMEFTGGLAIALAVGLSCGIASGYALITGLALNISFSWDRLGNAVAVVAAVGFAGVVIVQRWITVTQDQTELRTE